MLVNPTPEVKSDTTLIQEKVEPSLPIKNEEKKETESQEDPNWKAFREERKKDRDAKAIAEKMAEEKQKEVEALKLAMEAIFNQQSTNSVDKSINSNSEYNNDENEDQRIEKKVQIALAQREAQAEKSRIEREHQEYPQRLIQNYPDFHNMISQENLDYLDYHYPEVSRPLQRLKDGFEKWSDIYLAVKKFVPNQANAKRDIAKVDANFNKPKSISSTGLTQTGEGMGNAKLSQDKKAANWARMQKSLRGLSS